ncbi:cupin domain-containing protein [Niabella yanshanensis]|uniref:Cupin domain-containing protein n=1 Tax=Niabella yanshanensis TaxID=577386 RepID=A0ABZ0W7E6_9BACT|nr:cupin domain-containing protein [Niabella yanshanensis]WQD38584.1 cupin domain-containing protein [Niabella yanshanensis]
MERTIVNPVIKDQVTFKQTAKDIKGGITRLEVTLMPGGGTPPHYHRNFSETFIVHSGALTIQLKNRTLVLDAGHQLTVEPGQLHRFTNTTAAAVHFTTIVEPGSEGFENALHILYGLAGDNQTDDKGNPRSLLALAVISHISDMRPGGAGALMIPFLGLLNFIAKISGYDKKLVARYCINA